MFWSPTVASDKETTHLLTYCFRCCNAGRNLSAGTDSK